MKTLITTAHTAPKDRSRHWHEAIAATYFPLDLTFRDPDHFSGEVTSWGLGNDVSLSRLSSESLRYRRLPQHFRAERDEHFLVTVPARSEVFFSQCGKDVRCNPGGFILERSHEPYEFSHDEAADLWVMKVEAKMVQGRIRQPDRFCSLQFNGAEGAGGLFADMLHLIPRRFDAMTAETRSIVGSQLVDLLVLALRADERTLTSGSSSVRVAHLTRIETFVRRNLGCSDLSPEAIARGCGMSIRYLHELFRDTNQTVGSWVRDQRLEACREALAGSANTGTVAEISYRWGFSDQAQFSRSFKAHFGVSPKEYRAQARTKPAHAPND
jgi:AraC-like DNA-binding protein